MRSRLLAVAAGCATLAVVTGCSSGSSGAAKTAPQPIAPHSFSSSPRLPTQTPSTEPTSPSSPSPSPTAPIPGGNASLAAIVLTTTEVARAGIPVRGGVFTGGLSVAAKQKTLDECHATYPSDAKRIARIQTGYLSLESPKAGTLASNEVVKYGNDGAAEAYREITHALHNCPAHFPDGGKSIGSNTTVVARDSRLPDDQITATQLITEGKVKQWSAITFMYDGDLFSGVYVFRPTRAAALTVDRELARISATKLKAAFANEGTLV